jgi:hypothetical protein
VRAESRHWRPSWPTHAVTCSRHRRASGISRTHGASRPFCRRRQYGLGD